MRHAFGCNLIEGDLELRVEQESLTSDIGEFFDASGDELRLSQLYTGPFLDGFHLSDSTEFSHWIDRVRERTTSMACAALEVLANAAFARGDHARAIETWRARVAIDPLDAGPSMSLMEILAASGDRAGSIRHAQAYQKLIRQELDMEPDPRITMLARRFRRETPVSTPAPGLPVALASSDAVSAKSSNAKAEKIIRNEPRVAERLPRKKRRVSAVLATVAVGILGVAGALWSRGRPRNRDG